MFDNITHTQGQKAYWRKTALKMILKVSLTFEHWYIYIELKYFRFI